MNSDWEVDENVDESYLIRSANEVEDHLSQLNITKNILNPLVATSSFVIHSRKSCSLPQLRKDEIMILLESNMKSYYEETWGWDRTTKTREMFSNISQYIIVTENADISSKLVAFCHFQFTWDDEEEPEYPVLYIFELQVDVMHRQLGIGKEIMKILHHIASYYKMNKLMLTCFHINVTAMEFYKKLGYQIDSNSPSICGFQTDYEILSINT